MEYLHRERWRPWTSEQTEELKHMWLETNKSAREIANWFGCSRNAILGKLHRERIKSRSQIEKRKSGRKRKLK